MKNDDADKILEDIIMVMWFACLGAIVISLLILPDSWSYTVGAMVLMGTIALSLLGIKTNVVIERKAEEQYRMTQRIIKAIENEN